MRKMKFFVSGMAHHGEAMGRFDGKVVFVSNAIPGEIIVATPRLEKKDYIKAETLEVVSPSTHRTSGSCESFSLCGGCDWQHIEYDHQLELKRQVVENQLCHIGKIKDPAVRPVIPSDQKWHYRNRGDFFVNKEGRLGFVRKGSHDFVAIRSCLLMNPRINTLLSLLQEKCASKADKVTVRCGVRTDDFLIWPNLNIPSLPTGQAFYREKLNDLLFAVSVPSFFQVNTLQAGKLIKLVEDMVQPKGDEVIVDAYAGVGTFAKSLAGKAGRVLAIEKSASAAKDAAFNLEGLKNVEYNNESTEDGLAGVRGRVNAVILNPPRSGCSRKALETLAKLAPEKIIYVSCDPATLSRDINFLSKRGYELLEAQPVDMFPQTYHIETVVRIERVKG